MSIRWTDLGETERADIVHLSFKPPFVPGSYNRFVGRLVERSEGLRQVVVSFWRGAAPKEDSLGDRLVLVDDAGLALREWFRLRLPERFRGARSNGISGRSHLVYAQRALEVLERLRPAVIVCYDGRKLGGLLRTHIDWPCRLVLSQRGFSYHLDSRAHERLYSLASFDAVWALTASSYRFDRDRGQLYEPTVRVIPNGVDPEVFRPASEGEREALRAPLGLPLDRPIVLMLGRLVAKGVHVVLEAWDRVLDEIPEALLWIVGDGDSTYAERLRRTATAMEIEANVRLEGGMAPERIQDAYRASDIYAFPSLCGEGQSRSLLEAMACGLPCVVSSSPGMQETYDSQEVHFVEDPNVEGRFVAPLLKLLEDSEARVRLGNRARDAVLERFSEDDIADEVRDFLQGQIWLVQEACVRLALLLPDGVGVRNFVYSGFLDEATARGPVDIYAPAAEVLARETHDAWPSEVTWNPLIEGTDGAWYRTLRQTLLYAHMVWADTVSMRHNLARPLRGSWRNRLFKSASLRFGRWSATPSRMERLERRLLHQVEKHPDYAAWREVFQRTRPDALCVSNQKSPRMVAAVLAARSLDVPTATFVFSWDNLTSKGRIAVPFDHYLVWSDLMGEELRRYYPHVRPEQVHVVGTPQFAPYADESLLEPKGSFFESVGADPSRPLVCYSAAASDTVPEEPLHVRELLRLARAGRVPGDPQILVRPAPTDTDETRWAAVLSEFPEALFQRPAWRRLGTAAWTDVMPTREDVTYLANLTRHADLNVNIASTMTLDFALRDKPVVNVAFEVVDPPTFGTPLAEYYYRFDHYRPVVELGAVRVARSTDELSEHVNAYLADPSLDRANREALVDLEVGVPPHRVNAGFVATLAALAA